MNLAGYGIQRKRLGHHVHAVIEVAVAEHGVLGVAGNGRSSRVFVTVVFRSDKRSGRLWRKP